MQLRRRSKSNCRLAIAGSRSHYGEFGALAQQKTRKKHLDERFDEDLEETFPLSDPVSNDHYPRVASNLTQS